MDGAGSFGAGRSGSTIDPITFAKQPQTILRVLSWIFSLVVFASIVNEGYVNLGSERLHCVFNKNADACNYGVFMGLVGLLACSFFFMLDYKFSSISSVKDRKKAIMLEIGFSGSWTFLYFVGFCFLANQWSRTTAADLPLNQGADAARAAIAFSFFSIITWVEKPVMRPLNCGKYNAPIFSGVRVKRRCQHCRFLKERFCILGNSFILSGELRSDD
uniref:Synaptogyrin 3a n=1 Tax=Cyclopterus lumpus TaxID=8103 RepID=A0A8C2XJB9_CYCLU